VDLISPQTFFKIEMDSGVSAGDYAQGYQVFASNDGVNWSGPAVTGAGSSHTISVTFANQTARFIRVLQTGGSTHWWSLHEFNVLTTAATPAQSPGPTLLTEADTNRAIALDSVLFTKQPFALVNTLNFSPDQRTRVLLFATNLELLPGENLSAVDVEAIDSQNIVYPLSVEFVGKVPGYNWLSSVVVRLPENQSLDGDVSVALSLRGVTSNAVVLVIKMQ